MSNRRINVRAIIWLNNQLLAVKHKKSDGTPSDYYAVPGGGLNPHEPLQDGLIREIIEELGITPRVGKLLYIQQFNSERDDYDEELELFFHIENPEDFTDIDLLATSHGASELAVCEFIDPTDKRILPAFLATANIDGQIASEQPSRIYVNFTTPQAALSTQTTSFIPSNEVDTAIDRLAHTIVNDYPKTPLFIALLKGAAPFASKLMHAIASIKPSYFPDLDYMAVSTYGDGHEAGAPQVTLPLRSDPSGREVIVLDDVLDKGVTAELVTSYLHEQGARDIKVAVLVRKNIERVTAIDADYYCFESDDSWLYGMGMDDGHAGHEAHRWNSDIKKVA